MSVYTEALKKGYSRLQKRIQTTKRIAMISSADFKV